MTTREETTPTAPDTDPYRPPAPAVTQLNRNALVVIAVLCGATALTAVVFLTPGTHATHGGRPDTTVVAPPHGGAQATFLDVPPREAGRNDSRVGRETGAANLRFRLPDSLTLPQPNVSTGAEASSVGSMHASVHSHPTVEVSDAIPSADSSFVRVLADRTVVLRPASDRGTADGMSPADVSAWREAALNSGSQTPAEPLPTAAASAGAPVAEPRPFGPPRGRAAFLHEAAATAVVSGSGEVSSIQRPASPYVLTAGTAVPAALVTDVMSELPGAIIGQVTRDVYDSPTERLLLIPKGARLIGRYDDRVVAGQDRLLIAWTRLIFPDGRSLALPGLAAADPGGASGLTGDVNNHYWRLFANAALLSVLSAGFQLSQPRSSSVYVEPSAGQIAAGAVGQELTQTGTDLLRRNGEVPPTIMVRAGTPLSVILVNDLAFAAPYTDARVGVNP